MAKNESLPTIDTLRRAIPKQCFQSSILLSFGYLARDILYATALMYGATKIPSIETAVLRYFAWVVYGFLQGLVGTGMWIIAHECGHGAFSPYTVLNDVVGWIVHSVLLDPYFSWKITHARHHRYTGHMEKDTAFVPKTEAEYYAEKKRTGVHDLTELTEDTPLQSLITLLGHQIVGWQLYIFCYITAGKRSAAQYREKTRFLDSHLDPSSGIFTKGQQSLVIISDLGLLLMGIVLYYVGSTFGWYNLFGLYFVPYIWVHHWIVAITYLHHTHPEVPHYSASTWTFQKGALGTVDRNFGFIGRHFFHDIIDHHVVHHLFPRIPFYNAEEATLAIRPLLGSAYIQRKEESFLVSLWTTFRRCYYVSDSASPGGESGVFMWNS